MKNRLHLLVLAAAALVLVGVLTAATFVPANFGRIVHRTVCGSSTNTYTALYSDEYIVCSGSNYTVTLPPALVNGLAIKIVAGDQTHTVAIAPHGTDTIALFTTSLTIGPTNSVTLISDGVSNWEK